MDDLRYPIGKFIPQMNMSEEERRECIRRIAETPARVSEAVKGLDDARLDTPYREGGWTVRQVVHHLVDSHLNAYMRFKLTLTEDNPTLKTYDEKLWAETADSRTMPVDVSLTLLESLHARWVSLLNSLPDTDFKRKCHHPESGPIDMEFLLSLYAWHGRHHEAHITGLRKRKGW